MKNISPELLAALGQDLTKLCRLWALTKPTGEVLRYTDHHSDITFEGNVYSAQNAFSATATQLTSNSLSSDVDVSVVLGSTGIDYQQLERGIYDNAPFELSMVNYSDLSAGKIVLLNGNVRNVTLVNKIAARLSLGPNTDKITKSVCEIYTAYCRAGFGDARCKVDLSAHTDAFTVDNIASSQSFHALELAARHADYYAQGTVTWLTGDNAGTRIEVVRNTTGTILTLLPCPMPVQIGDTGEITRGCFKTVAACQGYSNLPNFRGEPYVPTEDGLL